jgi:hypothetical protein
MMVFLFLPSRLHVKLLGGITSSFFISLCLQPLWTSCSFHSSDSRTSLPPPHTLASFPGWWTRTSRGKACFHCGVTGGPLPLFHVFVSSTKWRRITNENRMQWHLPHTLQTSSVRRPTRLTTAVVSKSPICPKLTVRGNVKIGGDSWVKTWTGDIPCWFRRPSRNVTSTSGCCQRGCPHIKKPAILRQKIKIWSSAPDGSQTRKKTDRLTVGRNITSTLTSWVVPGFPVWRRIRIPLQ